MTHLQHHAIIPSRRICGVAMTKTNARQSRAEKRGRRGGSSTLKAACGACGKFASEPFLRNPLGCKRKRLSPVIGKERIDGYDIIIVRAEFGWYNAACVP